MGWLGRDPSFFNYVEGSVADRILGRTEYALTQLDTWDNPYLNYIITGIYPLHALPHYLRQENISRLRKHLDRLTIFNGSPEDVLKKYGQNSFNVFNLSDIFEYMSPQQYDATLQLFHQLGCDKGRIAFWNMLAERDFS